MQCVQVLSDGVVTVRSDLTIGTCSGAGLYVLADSTDVLASQITSDQVGQAFLWGFGAVVFFWFAGYCVGVAKRAISKT